MSEERSFASRYRAGVLFTPRLGCLLLPILIAPGALLLRNIGLAFAFAALTFVLTVLVAGVWRRRRPALLLDSEGMSIEGLPQIAWSDVASVRRDPDSRAGPSLVVRLKRELASLTTVALRPSPLWRPAGEDVVILNAGLLEDQPAEIESAFRYFLGR